MFEIITGKINDYLNKNKKKVVDSYRIGFKIALREMNQTARKKHRYTRRKGFLEKATNHKVNDRGMELNGSIFIADDIAKYGFFIHNGFKSWAPDQFVYKATEDSDKIIKDTIEKQMKIRGVGKWVMF